MLRDFCFLGDLWVFLLTLLKLWDSGLRSVKGAGHTSPAAAMISTNTRLSGASRCVWPFQYINLLDSAHKESLNAYFVSVLRAGGTVENQVDKELCLTQLIC